MSTFDDLAELADDRQKLFDRAAHELAARGQWHQLFDLRLMQTRRELGLPLEFRGSIDDVDVDLRDPLEQGYVTACREVGQLLLDAGRVREAWMYLRPAGDKEAARQYLERVVPDDDNAEELIELSLYEGIDPARGFAWLLGRNGTCNSITALDGLLGQLESESANSCAAVLLRHVYSELRGNLRGHLHRLEGEAPSDLSIVELIDQYPALMADGSYHLDASHLASTVRFARSLTEPGMLRQALELCSYGSRLSKELQYPGEPPFEDVYQSHRLLFQALLGEQVEEAIAYFRQQADDAAKNSDAPDYLGAAADAPLETLLELLSRCGRPTDALEAFAELAPTDRDLSRRAPSLLDLAQQSGAWDRYFEICRDRDDLLGFAAGKAVGGAV